jgi:TonB family protein
MKNAAIYRVQLRVAAFLMIVFSTTFHSGRAQEPGALLPESQIREVASRILKKADKADCKRGCRIVVANFVFSSGLTSQLGIELADQFSRELASQRHAIQIINLSELRSYLEGQRIPGALLNSERAKQWLGQAVGATSILTGTLEETSASLELKVRLLSCLKDKVGPEESITFSYSGPPGKLDQTEAYPQQLPATNGFADPSLHKAGESGVTPPRCVYCPNPSYTDPARTVKFSGGALLEAVISEQGQAVQARVLRGLPYGLNQASLNAVRTWKFKPAMDNGKPVAAKVPIDVTFNIR